MRPLPSDLLDLVGRAAPATWPASARLLDLPDRDLVRAEALAAVDERDLARGVEQVERPVAGGVAAADDDHLLARELRLLADQVVGALALPRRHVVAGQLLRLEGAVAAGDDDRAREEVALVGHEPQDLPLGVLGVGLVLDAVGGRLEVHRHVELLDRLLAELLDEVLGEDAREARDVEDPLLRVERRELAAEVGQRVDRPGRSPRACRPRTR